MKLPIIILEQKNIAVGTNRSLYEFIVLRIISFQTSPVNKTNIVSKDLIVVVNWNLETSPFSSNKVLIP